VKFPTPPEPEKVKSHTPKPLDLLEKAVAKALNTKEREDKEAQPVSLSPHHGADALEDETISPEVMRKFGLRYSTKEWPPPRRADTLIEPGKVKNRRVATLGAENLLLRLLLRLYLRLPSQ